MKKYKPLFTQYDENLRLSDLKNNAGMSDFTKGFRKERNKIMKPENKTAKLVYCEIGKKEDFVLFKFTTLSTDKYPKTHKTTATVPTRDFKLVS